MHLKLKYLNDDIYEELYFNVVRVKKNIILAVHNFNYNLLSRQEK